MGQDRQQPGWGGLLSLPPPSQHLLSSFTHLPLVVVCILLLQVKGPYLAQQCLPHSRPTRPPPLPCCHPRQHITPGSLPLLVALVTYVWMDRRTEQHTDERREQRPLSVGGVQGEGWKWDQARGSRTCSKRGKERDSDTHTHTTSNPDTDTGHSVSPHTDKAMQN